MYTMEPTTIYSVLYYAYVFSGGVLRGHRYNPCRNAVPFNHSTNVECPRKLLTPTANITPINADPYKTLKNIGD